MNRHLVRSLLLTCVMLGVGACGGSGDDAPQHDGIPASPSPSATSTSTAPTPSPTTVATATAPEATITPTVAGEFPEPVSGTVLYRANSERTALYAVEPVRAEPSVRWQVEVGEQVNTRLLAGEALFAATDSGALLALDAAMGDELWTINLSGPVIGAFAYADGTLFIGTRSQGLLAIDTSRIALWSSRVFAYRLSKSRRSAG